MLQHRQCTYNVTLRRVRVTIFLSKSKNITYSECIVCVALVNQHITRMSRIMLWSVAFLDVSTASTFSHKGKIFGKKSYRTENMF